jgi:thioredoxin-related protein
MANILKSKKVLFLIVGISAFLFMGFKKPGGDSKGIKWMSFNDAVKLNKEHPKKLFIDVYTSWCGWCKRMDADTYTDPTVIDYVNKHFYAVRLDAETRDTFQFNNHTFVNAYPAGQRGAVNELASSMLDGKLAYPTTVYFDEKINRLTYVQSYLAAKDLMPILTYFGEDKYKTMKFDDYKKSLDPTPVVSSPAATK